MIRAWCFAFAIVASSACSLQAQSKTADLLRTNPKFLQSFRDCVRPVSECMARVQSEGKDAALGIVVGADGWILTKAHDLDGKIRCRLKDGRDLEARLVGVHEDHDLAILKIDAVKLAAIAWSHSKLVRSGSWVASVGLAEDPVAIGVVGVATRKQQEAYLGIIVDSVAQGLFVTHVLKDGAADKAGVQPKDLLVRVNGQKYSDTDDFMQFLSGHRPGDTITLSIRRDKKDLELKATLQGRSNRASFREEFQNRMGSELSSRRVGYSVILQHDSVLKPSDCGGPLVNLDGRVVGINITRAGRVETWAIPAEVVQPLITELKSGRLAPKAKKSEPEASAK